jgi:hypothetical protein
MLRKALFLAVALASAAAVLADDAGTPAPDWAFNATIIEACTCPMFCQCYFNPMPSPHHMGCAGCMKEGERYCRFNNAFRVNHGHWGAVKLDGAKFWLAGDLGGDFTKGQMDWAIVVYDKATTKEQREALAQILPHVYPVKWSSFASGEGAIEWSANKDEAHALLDGGKSAEVKLKRFQGMTDAPIVVSNLRYWGVPRNDGFILMPNEVEAYRVGDKPFEVHGTNGFMITIDIAAKDVAAAPKGTGGGY